MAETPTRDVTTTGPRGPVAASSRMSGLDEPCRSGSSAQANAAIQGDICSWGEAMNRPAGLYRAPGAGDLRATPTPKARRPRTPCAATPRSSATRATHAGVERASSSELLTLRDGIEAPPPEEVPPVRRRRAIVVIAGAVAVVVVATAVLLATRSGSPAEETFCVRNVEAAPAAGAVGVVCADDVRLRPFPGAPADQALGTVASGTKFEIDRFSSSGACAHGTARLPDGGTEGWIEGGWFCPPGIESPATAVFHRRRTVIRWSQ